jgi:putative DNA primase/helicase
VQYDEDFRRRITRYESERQAPAPAAERTFIAVLFKEKDEAKALGAKWDRQEQSWYVPHGIDPAPFAKWIRTADNGISSDMSRTGRKRQYLAVPYADRSVAKAAGAKWDKAAKSWYAGPQADMATLERWRPENVPLQQSPAMTPKEEFAEALRSVGCVVSGEHPVMDGKKHRIPVKGDKPGEKTGSGFYVGHADGHPAGYVKNNRTGADLKWKSKGYVFDPEQKARLLAEAAVIRRNREADHAERQEQAALRVRRQLAGLLPVERPTPYMEAKGVLPHPGIFTDKEGRKTYVPATDAEGKLWTMQYIQEDGAKRFAKDSRKEGCFHAVGGMDALARSPALVIAEGYATAASLSQALGFATVAAFDAGNLPCVAKALHGKFPDKPVVIAGDDDRHLEATQGVNPGRTKAQEAADATGGKFLLPIFAPSEQADNPKEFTDFNDLATKSALGKEGIDRQVRSVVGAVIEAHRARIERQERLRRQERRPRRAAKIG